MSIHDERLTSVLIHLAGEYISREAGRSTLITPTRADVSRDGKNATIYVSVFPESDQAHAVEFLTRHKDEFRNFLKKEARLSRIPFVKFEFDAGEAHRQHLDEISKDL